MNVLNIETCKRFNASPERLQFELHFGHQAVRFDVEPYGEVDVPKAWCDPRPSSSKNRQLSSVLQMEAPQLVERLTPSQETEREVWRAKQGPVRHNGKPAAKSEKGESGIPG